MKKIITICLSLWIGIGTSEVQSAPTVLNVFGYKAFPFSNIAFQNDWDRALKNILIFCEADQQCPTDVAHTVTFVKKQTDKKRLDIVNKWVNDHITYVKESDDTWSSPIETLNGGLGDCEDFAILKMALLYRAGIPLEKMSLVVLEITSKLNTTHHAVLAVHLQERIWILDNRAAQVREDVTIPDYRPMLQYSNTKNSVLGKQRPSS